MATEVKANATSLLVWWDSLSRAHQFQMLSCFDDVEAFAHANVERYARTNSPSEILYEMQKNSEGREILRRYKGLTDDILDFAFLDKEDHYWNECYPQILADAFASSLTWFTKMYSSELLPTLADLRKAHTEQLIAVPNSDTGPLRTGHKVVLLALALLLIILLVTNPTKNDFDDFIGLRSMNYVVVITSREKNYFLFSYHQVVIAFADVSRDKDIYLGVFGNFYLLEGQGKSKQLE